MGLRPCGPQVVVFSWSPQLLDLFTWSSSWTFPSVAGRLREISEMADTRDWGGGGDDPEESIQRMIERIWESLTDIRARMDQQAPVPSVAVPPGDGEAVPVAPVPPRVEVPFAAPAPPPPPMLIAEEPVMQVEKFLRLQPPTYSGGPNPDTTEHWVNEIERVFATMRCPAADRVVLAAYQLRGFALEWWRLKMQTTFAGRAEEAITWSEFLDVFNDTFFPIQVQQVKREQFRTLQQGNSSVLEYQMRFMALSRYAPYVVSDNNIMVEYFIKGLRVELQDAIVPLMCKTVEEAAQRAATLERSIRTRQVGESGSEEEDGEVVRSFSRAEVRCRFGSEMKYDLLQFSWSWQPGMAVDLLASRYVVVYSMISAAVSVDV
ncbi:hypothetical protein Taro_003534 [Colocasia esculenta]|uniref:Retrotransposon gag domain-containing protein n=1 Tax=Colocasia esculenta TaxID=4460 RepID=A0A843TMC1_COLES|nr:hypothetical protein [Colocasia esculenta]